MRLTCAPSSMALRASLALLLLLCGCSCEDTSPLHFLSSKTRYYPSDSYASQEQLPPHCSLVHVSGIHRHGSRHATKLQAAARFKSILREASRSDDLTSTGYRVLSWTSDVIDSETPELGKLTEGGAKECTGVGERVVARLGLSLLELLDRGDVLVDATHKPRVLRSRDAFLLGLNLGLTRLQLQLLASNASSLSPRVAGFKLREHLTLREPAAPPCVHPSNASSSSAVHAGGSSSFDIAQYSRLRFFDVCSSYARWKAGKRWTDKLSGYAANATRPGSHENAMLKSLFSPSFLRRLALDGVGIPPPPRAGYAVPHSPLTESDGGTVTVRTIGVAADVFELCQIDAVVRGDLTRFCSLFQGHVPLMRKLELMHDTGDWFKKGPGGDDVTTGMACVLLEDFFEAADNALAGTGPVAAFRFAHAESVIPFLSLLNLYAEPGLPSLDATYVQQLAQGTQNLVNSSEIAAHVLAYAKEHAAAAAAGANATHPPGADGYIPAPPAVYDTLPWLHMDNNSSSTDGSGCAPVDAYDADVHAVDPLHLRALKHPWSGSRAFPMAANVQWHVYDCGEDTGSGGVYGAWVKLLHNEREIAWPPCATSDWQPLANKYGLRFACPYSIVKQYYRTTAYTQRGIRGTCDAQDWVAMCGGLTMPRCEDVLRP